MMKRTIPLLITAVSGLVLAVSSFIPFMQNAGEEVAIWFDILASIAFILGGGNLIRGHLRDISDKAPGWGYSAIALAGFILMLTVGLFKFGSPPEPSQEFYGASTVPISLAQVPQFQVDVQLPSAFHSEDLPKSAIEQFAFTPDTNAPNQLTGKISFRGWMSAMQADDLAKVFDSQNWRCQIERLNDLAQPPESFNGRVNFSADHRKLIFQGIMSDEDERALISTLPKGEPTEQAIAALKTLSRRVTTYEFTHVPESLTLPRSTEDALSLDGTELKIVGPMSVTHRDRLASRWTNPERLRPQSSTSIENFLKDLESRGPLSSEQRKTYETFSHSVWNADELIEATNAGGIALATSRTACEIHEELAGGAIAPRLTNERAADVQLSEEQKALLRKFATTPEMSQPELMSQLNEISTLSPGLSQALNLFLDSQPTVAEQRKELCFQLLRNGKLTKSQIDFLLNPYRSEKQWEKQVGHAFLAAHQLKYPWSGDYSAQGTPFWWLYEYVFQPLVTTTFALLGFYVASAAFRAFRAKNIEATLLLGTAFIILLGRTSLGPLLTSWLPDSLSFLKMDALLVYIMTIFNTAGNRAIMIGIALGTIAMSLRVILGVDKSYLGSDK